MFICQQSRALPPPLCDSPSGTFNPHRGQSTPEACVPCGAGTSNPLLGQSSAEACEPCPAGTFNAVAGQGRCVKCEDGKYQDADGASARRMTKSWCAGGFVRIA